jgi:hypothetical protein
MTLVGFIKKRESVNIESDNILQLYLNSYFKNSCSEGTSKEFEPNAPGGMLYFCIPKRRK